MPPPSPRSIDWWQGEELAFKGYAASPSDVLRDGLPSNWAWDAQEQEVVLLETGNGQPHVWQIIP